VVGPDGKAYPTWHPPTGPGGCTFGHEHGRDPSGSALYSASRGIPFGYANEMLALADPAHPRDEDHVGQKLEWENDVPLLVGGDAGGGETVSCDVLYKLHQGTHSKDAFSNNLHELVYRLHCEDGTELRVTLLAAIGQPGGFARACTEGVFVAGGAPVPANSPVGLGIRYIPDRSCVEAHMLVADGRQSNYGPALHERWNTYNLIDRQDGRLLAFFNPHFHVDLPSRFHDPALAPAVGRPIDVCYETTPDGRHTSGGACSASTGDGSIPDLAYDDPRSRFNGSERSVQLNVTRLANEGGPSVWYTDALGHGGSRDSFPGAIRQVIAPVTREVGVDFDGPFIGDGRQYGGSGVRSPN
jgi:hypothetical protein